MFLAGYSDDMITQLAEVIRGLMWKKHVCYPLIATAGNVGFVV